MFTKKYNNYSTLITLFIRRYKILSFASLFILLWGVSAIIFYIRFPSSYLYANFFAEDGSIFLDNYLKNGPLASSIMPFNGYFVTGLYACISIANIINDVFLGGDIFTLPRAFAITSYLVLGFCATLCLLLYRFLGLTLSIILVFLVATLPLPNTTHQVIGTIGNLKWIFFFIAYIISLLWIIYRHKLTHLTSAALGSMLLLCLYTNAYSYLTLGIIYLVYSKDLLSLKPKKTLLRSVIQLIKQPGVQVIGIISLLALIQLIYVKINGIPTIPGYLDTNFEWHKATEILIGRTVLFELIFRIWTHLSDGIVIALFASFLVSGAVLLRGMRLYIFHASIFVAIAASLMFVITRPGISAEFNGYQTTGPDHFFYAQNLIMYIPFILVGSAFMKWLFKSRRLSFIATVGLLIVLLLVNINNRYFISHNNLMESMTGTFAQNLLSQCKSPNSSLKLPLYPIGVGFTLTISKDYCQDVSRKIQPQMIAINSPIDTSTALPIGSSPDFSQTFISQQANLDGIRLVLSTYGQKNLSGTYLLKIMDENCSNTIRTGEIGRELFDNYAYNIHFNSIAESTNKKFCFRLQKINNKTKEMLAVRKATTNTYRDGELFVKNIEQSTDMVFWPLYSEYR